MLGLLPEDFVANFYLARKSFVEDLARGSFDKLRLLELSTRLTVMVATCGPAGVNVAPFMVSFIPREEHLEEVNRVLRRFVRNKGSKGSLEEAARTLLETVYNDRYVDPLKLVTHLMNKGHTWTNIASTGKATIGILIPPDKGAYEVRTRAYIVEDGPVYEYVNLVHDVIHFRRGERSHPWYPALIFEIVEIYDNSYKMLGKKIYP